MPYPAFFLLLFIAHGVWAQVPVSGTVLDPQRQPLAFVNVAFYPVGQPDQITGGTTDVEGQFRIELQRAGRYELRISFIGLEDWQQTVDIQTAQDLGTFSLSLSANELNEIVVTADRGIIEQQGNQLVFNVDKSPLASGFDGLQVLQRSPNIFVTSEGTILMRNETATILINGRISNLRGEELSSFLSNLQSEEIKSIQIQTNPAANTDASNSGGIVNIILKKKPLGFDGNLRADYSQKSRGDYNFNPATRLNYGAERWNIYGSLNYRNESSSNPDVNTVEYFETDNLLRTDNWRERQQQRSTTRLGFVVDASPRQTFGLEYFGNRYLSDTDITGEVNLTNGSTLLETGSTDLLRHTDIGLDNGVFNYSLQLDTLGGLLKVFADYSSHRALINVDVISDYAEGLFDGSHERIQTDTETGVLSLQADLKKNLSAVQDGLEFEAGLRYTDSNRDNGLQSNLLINNTWEPIDARTSFFNYRERITAGYFSVSRDWKDKLYLQFGLRAEYTDLLRTEAIASNNIAQQYLDWFPSLFVSQQLQKDNSLSF
ncbi:MAG: outer membrane beta-barrel protein, partial [Bacteroidota bacterium]